MSQQPNLCSQRHALAMNETNVILKIFTRSAAILMLCLAASNSEHSTPEEDGNSLKESTMTGGLRNVTSDERLREMGLFNLKRHRHREGLSIEPCKRQ